MTARLRPHLTYANVVSTICLFLLLGGGSAIAAREIIDGSKLQKGSVSGSKLTNNSVTGAKIKDKSVRIADFAPGTKDALQGVPGEPGAPGGTGPPGTFSGAFESPSGQFKIQVTDTGIMLTGPTASVTMDQLGIELVSGVNEISLNPGIISIESGALLQLDGAAMTQIGGGVIRLNGGTFPAARQGDTVAPGGVFGIINNGSQSVFIGN